MIAPRPDIDLDTFHRYAGLSLPRHVSYPMPTAWHEMSEADARAMWAQSGAREPAAGLSLYLHIPFCASMCRYCGCTRVAMEDDASDNKRRVDEYVAALMLDIERTARNVGTHRQVRHIHWGGGSPTYLTDEQITRIQRRVQEAFDVSDAAEIAMEVDPRTASAGKLRMLRELGFNRISLGVQDFDPKVQEHVHRVQPFELVQQTVTTLRDLGFRSINFDLIYGLPYQTVDTICETLKQVIQLSPDRVAYYHYAQIPDKIAAQRGLDYDMLPDSEAKLEMYLVGAEMFVAAGYDFIGLDHFARPEEMLARALTAGTIQRNFQGMTTGGGLDLIGLGASSIGQLTDVGFLQNAHQTQEYVRAIEAERIAIIRGKRLTEDDRIRQAVIGGFYCTTRVQPESIEREFGIDFADYFAREVAIMKDLERDGLVTLDADGTIAATMPLGRVLMRTIAAVFDAYIDPEAYRVGSRNCYSANA